MLAALMLMALLAIIAIAILTMSAADRRRAIRHSRTEVRESCVQAGLTYARSYFANTITQWPLFFSTPQQFNPVNLPVTNPSWSGPQTKADIESPSGLAALKVARPELFVDLDADGNSDAYIFIRDNYDEFPPALVNFQVDNDQNAIVGAICISTTMTPRREDNTIDTDQLLMESLLSVNQIAGEYGSQYGGNSSGTGNLNN
jgi:hypothetical protein